MYFLSPSSSLRETEKDGERWIERQSERGGVERERGREREREGERERDREREGRGKERDVDR